MYQQTTDTSHLKHDIVCLWDTTSDDPDSLDLRAYKYDMKYRKRVMKRIAGDVIICVDYIDTEWKCVHWCKIASKLITLDEDVIIGCAYIPPENTIFSSSDAFIEIGNKHRYIAKKHKCVFGIKQ